MDSDIQFYCGGSVGVPLKGQERGDYIFVGGLEGLEYWLVWVKAGVDKIQWNKGFI